MGWRKGVGFGLKTDARPEVPLWKETATPAATCNPMRSTGIVFI